MTRQTFPEPTVGIFILNPKGELLLLKSHKWPEKYTVPGGHVELGETLEEAARREALEETGLEIYDLEFIVFQEFIYDPAFWKQRHFLFFDFVAKTNSSEVTLNDEAEGFVWVPLQDALDLPIDQYSKVAINKYLEQGV